jgi:IS1 family transposase
VFASVKVALACWIRRCVVLLLQLQADEIWGFVGKKDKNVKLTDDPTAVGSVWTFCAIDSDSKIVPSFKVGRRDSETTNAFMADLASRLKNRIQLASDGFAPYLEAVEEAWGADVTARL